MNRDKMKYSECIMHQTMAAALGTKWKPIVIWKIRDRKARFGQIAAAIGVISRKVLTDTLKELEEDGLILREEREGLPLRVEYSLTKKGAALLPILKQLHEWGVHFRGEENL